MSADAVNSHSKELNWASAFSLPQMASVDPWLLSDGELTRDTPAFEAAAAALRTLYNDSPACSGIRAEPRHSPQ